VRIAAEGVEEQIMATQKRPSVHLKSSSHRKPWEDEVLREVYAARDAYAAEHSYDLDRYAACGIGVGFMQTLNTVRRRVAFAAPKVHRPVRSGALARGPG